MGVLAETALRIWYGVRSFMDAEPVATAVIIGMVVTVAGKLGLDLSPEQVYGFIATLALLIGALLRHFVTPAKKAQEIAEWLIAEAAQEAK